MLATIQDVVDKSFDYVIIGGGTAGLTLAARLSEDPANTVCVLEAGDVHLDDPNIVKIDNFGRTFGDPHYDWTLFTTKQESLNGRAVLWSRGKGLGGSSGMNAMCWFKPPAEEIDDIERLGNPGWNWKNLQRYFHKVERYVPPPPEVSKKYKLGVHPGDMGSEGALPISFPRAVGESEHCFTETLKNAGFSPAPHPYGGNPTGFYTPLYNHDPATGIRSYSFNCYYLPCKDRKNLVVLTNALVAQIVTEKMSDGLLHANGVEFIHGDKSHTVKAKKEVIVSAGSLLSPQVLELSGIGRRDVLEKVGVEVKLELPGVGENVQEHIVGGFNFELKKGHEFVEHDTVIINEAAEQNGHSVGRFTLGMSKIGFHPVEQITAQAQTIYEKARATVARLEKDGASPGLLDQYKIQLERLQPGQHQSGPGCEIILAPSLIPGIAGVVQAEEGKAYMTTCWAMNHFFSRGTIHIASKDPAHPPEMDPHYFEHDVDMDITLETAKLMRRIPLEIAPLKDIVEKEIAPGPSVKTDEELREFIRQTFSTTWHTCGSCSMMPEAKGGVVDHELKVHGTANIRVVDLSILPLHFASHPQATVYAIAERAADIIQGKL